MGTLVEREVEEGRCSPRLRHLGAALIMQSSMIRLGACRAANMSELQIDSSEKQAHLLLFVCQKRPDPQLSPTTFPTPSKKLLESPCNLVECGRVLLLSSELDFRVLRFDGSSDLRDKEVDLQSRGQLERPGKVVNERSGASDTNSSDDKEEGRGFDDETERLPANDLTTHR